MRYQPFSLSLLKSCGLRTCGLESKVLASKAWRRKCSPRNDWKQCCVLGRQEDPELQECFKSLPFLSAACIYIFFSPPNSCWMKVWFYTLMHVAHLAWAETAESTGALLSTWHNNHHEYVMSSSIRNKSSNTAWSYCTREPAAHKNISQEQSGYGVAWLDPLLNSGMEMRGQFFAQKSSCTALKKPSKVMLVVYSKWIYQNLEGGVWRAQHRAKHLAYKGGSPGVENIIKVLLQDLEEGRTCWNLGGTANFPADPQNVA